ncbi:hypothetical protein CRG98_015438 [Punica granatum]|uniref:Uncharacterized protein n=1 Tax=Punica granatum TaxID=22663 RepID=A0A2I0K7R9_PUNGR|nr:hypothetical protein CRG98_015438 [Punica granatum]
MDLKYGPEIWAHVPIGGPVIMSRCPSSFGCSVLQLPYQLATLLLPRTTIHGRPMGLQLSEEKASMVHRALAVDKELQPDKVRREITVSDGKLSVHFEAVEARFLRASYSAFVDVLILATKTIEEFSQGVEL